LLHKIRRWRCVAAFAASQGRCDAHSFDFSSSSTSSPVATTVNNRGGASPANYARPRHFDNQYSLTTGVVRSGQSSTGGARRTAETNAAIRQRDTNASFGPPLFTCNWYCTPDSAADIDNDYNDVVETRQRKKQTSTTTAASGTVLDHRHHVTASPSNLAATTSRSVGTEEMRKTDAMTMTTGNYELDTGAKRHQLSHRHDSARQPQHNGAATVDHKLKTSVIKTTTAAESRDRDDGADDVTAVTRNVPHGT